MKKCPNCGKFLAKAVKEYHEHRDSKTYIVRRAAVRCDSCGFKKILPYTVGGDPFSCTT